MIYSDLESHPHLQLGLHQGRKLYILITLILLSTSKICPVPSALINATGSSAEGFASRIEGFYPCGIVGRNSAENV